MAISQELFPHKCVIEWWYFNGNLVDKHGNKYAFMNCLFKADPRKTNIPIVDKIPAKEVYFSHSVLSDLKKEKCVVRTHPLSIISEDSLKSKNLFINYLNPSPFGYINNEFIETKNGFKIKNEDLELFLKIKKKPFLHNKNGIFNVRGKKVFYYSFTNLEVEGKIMIHGKPIEVAGKAWMDHEWSEFAGEKNWNWFSIQLNNDVEIMIQDYNNKENVYVGINGKKPEFSNDAVFVTKKLWKSKLTGAEYPVEWEILIPSKDIVLDIYAPIKNQEIFLKRLSVLFCSFLFLCSVYLLQRRICLSQSCLGKIILSSHHTFSGLVWRCFSLPSRGVL